MSKKQFKSQASSSRAAGGNAFGGFGGVSSGSSLSYLAEPPNLTTISDPNLVVAFKNLSKKDSTTKAKALDDLLAYVQAHPFEQDGGAEDAILDAWVKVYPRMSIDNSRRVRELSHSLQYELLKSARKRMEKRLPQTVGSWLAGTYDKDRAVSRVAQDGIASFLNTDEKTLLFWKKCQSQILEYAQEALNETAQTLSDERTVSVDDAQATYYRVIGSSLSLVVQLLKRLNSEDISKHQEKYDNFLSNNKTLWGFVACEDASVRRTCSELLVVCLEKQQELVGQDIELIGKAFVSEGLKADQSGSAFQLLQALSALISAFPEICDNFEKFKFVSRLRHFVEKGPQNGPAEYWFALKKLITQVPFSSLPSDLENIQRFLKAVRSGITQRGAGQHNAPIAWQMYFGVVKHFMNRLENIPEQSELLKSSVFPVFEQYLRPSSENAQWTLANGAEAIVDAYFLCASTKSEDALKSLKEEWLRLGGLVVMSVQVSLPEQSKDHAKSQTTVAAEGTRFFELQSGILRKSQELKMDQQVVMDIIQPPSLAIVGCVIEILETRNGKPFGAAGTLESAIRLTPLLISSSLEATKSLGSFLENNIPRLIQSPSATHLIASLDAFRSIPGQDSVFEKIWSSAVVALLEVPDLSRTWASIRDLIMSDHVQALARQNDGLQKYFLAAYPSIVVDEIGDWSLFEACLTFGSFAETTITTFINGACGCLDSGADDKILDAALRMLQIINSRRPEYLRGGAETHLIILTKLLALTEKRPGSAWDHQISILKASLQAAPTNDASPDDQVHSPMIDIIRDNLENGGPRSLSVNTLVQQATAILNDPQQDFTKLLPDSKVWQEELGEHLCYQLNPALAITHSLGGAVFLAEPTLPKSQKPIARDSSGFATALRIAMYTARILEAQAMHQPIRKYLDTSVLYLLRMTAELASDQLGVPGNHMLCERSGDPYRDQHGEIAILEFISGVQNILSTILGETQDWRPLPDVKSSNLVQDFITVLLQSSSGLHSEAYYAARCLSDVLSTLVEKHGWQSSEGEAWLTKLDILKTASASKFTATALFNGFKAPETATTSIFTATALLTGLREALGTSKLVNNLCNRLVSDVTGASVTEGKTLDLLVYLNACLSVYDQGDIPVAQNRLMFAVKQVTSWPVNKLLSDLRLAAEVCKILQMLLPAIKDMYGSHWEAAIDLCAQVWSRCSDGGPLDERLPAINSSLRLATSLKSIQDPNDDFEEAIAGADELMSQSLIQLLTMHRGKENQPMQVVDEMICRQVAKLPISRFTDLTSIYPLVASDIRTIQMAAFDILHRVIPSQQEQLSVDVILEKRDATLPEELLSLLLDAPSLESYTDEELSNFPAPVRGYLLSWHVIFDCFTNASHKVREDYTTALKSEDYIAPLLQFIFDVLGHSAASPISLTKSNFGPDLITSYDPQIASTEPSERDMQWLMIHLYYLSLKLTPSLVKKWYLECKSKRTCIAVESWTSAYFSPLIISYALNEVSAWASTQEVPASDDEKELIVKVSHKSREIFAGYEIDEAQIQIVIRLSEKYPLEGVKVEGLQRVAVSERKWQSWLMITQGVITFSGGSITDGLMTFRKNVQALLSGQTECAICYSFVSQDRRLPDKRCGTCKNLFHADCLFRWFSSSNSSTCPLCRNPFGYGDALRARERSARMGGAFAWD